MYINVYIYYYVYMPVLGCITYVYIYIYSPCCSATLSQFKSEHKYIVTFNRKSAASEVLVIKLIQ